jgi:putative hydrolase of the HAD superfamily
MIDFNNYKVIGFDLDNTLFNQELYEFEIFKTIAIQIEKDYGFQYNLYYKALKDLYLNDIKEATFDKAMIIINKVLPPNWEKYMQNTILLIYIEYIPNKLKLFDKTLEILDYFKEKDKKLILITNGRTKTQNIKIDKLNIRKYFNLILISDAYNVPKRKPDIFMFQESLKYFNISSTEMIYIGDDNIRDKASEKIGIQFINIKDLKL